MRSAVTLDVDGVRHYHAIHGLPPPTGPDPIWSVGVPRFLELCDALGVRATLFVVTADLRADLSADFSAARAQALLKQAHAGGHELASHSHEHRYDLSALPAQLIEDDLRRSMEALRALTGEAPRGFRAPGYNLSPALLDAIRQVGFEYDSSVMRAPAYWALRAAARARLAARGRPSASLAGSLRQFLPGYAPPGVRELPISTALGAPWLGTTLGLLPRPLGALCTALARATPRQGPLVLELHAVDLCDATDGFSPALVEAQPDLRVPLVAKRARLAAALRVLAPGARPLAEWC